MVRCTYLREHAALQEAGANEVFSGEGEVALSITESLLRTLGATEEQIDRERDRVRDDIFDVVPTSPTPATASLENNSPSQP